MKKTHKQKSKRKETSKTFDDDILNFDFSALDFLDNDFSALDFLDVDTEILSFLDIDFSVLDKILKI